MPHQKVNHNDRRVPFELRSREGRFHLLNIPQVEFLDFAVAGFANHVFAHFQIVDVDEIR